MPSSYAPVELNRHRAAELVERAAAAGLRVVDSATLDVTPVPGVVVANEYLDALPVHVLEVRGGRPLEVLVGIGRDGAFEEEVTGEPASRAVLVHLDALGATESSWPRASASRSVRRPDRGRPRSRAASPPAWSWSSTTAHRPSSSTLPAGGPGRS